MSVLPVSIARVSRDMAGEPISIEKVREHPETYNLIGERTKQFYAETATRGAAVRMRERIYDSWEYRGHA